MFRDSTILLENGVECVDQTFPRLAFQRHHPGICRHDIDHHKRKTIPIVVLLQHLHIRKIGLALFVLPIDNYPIAFKASPGWFVECICCGSHLSLVQILFPLFQTHYHQITITKTKEIKFEPRIKLNHIIYAS